MRFLRFIALLLVVLTAYSAQFILQPPLLTTSSSLLPSQVSALLPDLAYLRALVAGDIRELAFVLLAVAAVTFGLIAVPWPLTASPLAAIPATFALPSTRRRQRLAWAFVILAVLVALGLSIGAGLGFNNALQADTTAGATIVANRLQSISGQLGWLFAHTGVGLTALWVSSLLSFFVGCALFPWRFVQEQAEATAVGSGVQSTKAGGLRLLLLLLLAALLYGWRLTEIPLLVDQNVAQVALWSSEWLRLGDHNIFSALPFALEPELSLSGLATTITTLFFLVTNDLLLSVRLSGLLSALTTIGATWLLGIELLRQPLAQQPTIPPGEQGQWPAFLAVILVMMTTPLLLFSRLPVLLETVAWGSLGCWALLRGLRTGDRLAVGLSGVLISLSAILYTPGLVFVITTFCWWVGYGVVQVGLAPHHLSSTMPAARFRGYFLVWLVGLGVTAAPTVSVYLASHQQWPQLWQGNLAAHWLPTLLSFAQPGDLSQIGGAPLPLFHPLLTPLLALALGALCFNFDRRTAWFLLTWVSSALICAMVLSPVAPSWPALLPVVPATALLLAFGLDRLRVTILQSAGAWSSNLFNYLLLGLLMWVGVNNAVAYYHFAQQRVDAVSALGHELRTIPAARPVLVVGLPATTANGPQIRFFTNDWQRPPQAAVTFVETLPPELPADAIVLFLPVDRATLDQLQVRYPTGTLVTRRDHLANPVLYRYTISDAATSTSMTTATVAAMVSSIAKSP